MYNKNLATGDTLLSQKNKTVNKNNKKKVGNYHNFNLIA